ESSCDSVQSFAEVGKFHPWWMARIADDGRIAPWEGDELFHGVYRRQNLPPAHIPDGGVIAVTRRALMLQVGQRRAGQVPQGGGGARPASEPASSALRRLALPDAPMLAKPHAFLGADRRAITTAPGEVIDIDSPTDLLVADAILRQRAGVLT